MDDDSLFDEVPLEMSDEELFKKNHKAYWLRRLQEKYKPYLARKNKRTGGIFTSTTCGNLLGLTVKGRKKRVKTYDFWYDARKSVKTALTDLQLFIETEDVRGRDDVDKVLNRETLANFVEVLLNPPRYRSGGRSSRAKLAQLFVEYGLNYFREESRYITKSQMEIMEHAIDASRQLTLLEVPEKERDDALKLGAGDSE
jgi:hypothetical protein